jgi:hypothetical protein
MPPPRDFSVDNQLQVEFNGLEGRGAVWAREWVIKFAD